MATTNFIDGTTPVVADWLNDVDEVVYGLSQTGNNKGAELVNGVDTQLTDYSALRTYTGSKTRVYVSGNLGTAVGQGIAGTFVHRAGDVSSADNGGTIIVDGTGRRWHREFSGGASVRWFSAVGDGVTDDTVALQSAINSGIKLITSPANSIYRITNTLTIDTNNLTFDLSMSELLLDDATGLKDHIFLGNGTTQRYSIILKEIVFTRQQVATAGWAINSNLIGVCQIEKCRVFGNNEIFGGIKIYRGIIITIAGCHIDGCVSEAILLEGSGLVANRTVDVSIRETRMEACLHGLRTHNFVEGVYFRDNIIYNTTSHGALIDASTDANGLVSFKLQESDFDTCAGFGLYIDKVSNVQVTGCWFSNNTNNDLVVKENTNGLVASGNQHYPNAIAVQVYGNNTVVNGNLIAGGTIGVHVAPAATNTNITGNTLSYAQHGVDLTTAAQTLVEGNLIHTMSIAPITGSGGTGTVIRGNKGDTAVGVSSFITVGASPFTYTAGRRPEHVSVFGGTVSQVALGANAVSFVTNCSVSLAPGQSVTVTYSSVPFMVRNVQ